MIDPAEAGESSGEDTTSRRVLTARRIAELVNGRLIGDPDASVTGVASIDRALSGQLTFLGSSKYAPLLEHCAASVLLVTPALADAAGRIASRVVVEKPQEALLKLLPELFPPARFVPGIDPTVRIGRGATLGAGVSIGPYVVIGAGARIGARVRLDAHCVVGDGVVIGDDSRVFPHATLYPGAQVGRRVILHAGVRIASDGFGYVHGRGAHQKIPHVGRCIIEDDVEIGANTTIDRGSIDDTVIGAGTKIDNLVQIAHNVRIGRLCLIVSQAGIAGSTRIGDGCVIGGQAGLAGHITIGDRARIGAQGGVLGNVPADQTWSGYPARPHSVAMRAQAALFRLSTMMRDLDRLIGAPDAAAAATKGEES